MISSDALVENKNLGSHTVLISRNTVETQRPPTIIKIGNSALILDFSKYSFEEWLENPTITFRKKTDMVKETNTEHIFVSPIIKSIKLKMKVKIGGKISPIPVDEDDVVFLDE